MSVKADRWIRKMALENRMIEPFVESQKSKGVISYGLSAYGYDIRESILAHTTTQTFDKLKAQILDGNLEYGGNNGS